MEQDDKKEKLLKHEAKQPRAQQNWDNKQPKIDSNVVAKELIIGDEQKLAKWLFQVRQFKNPDYPKFTGKIFSNLMSVERFIAISHSANEQNTTGHQMTSIFNGFAKYWKTCQVSLQTMQHLFKHYEQVYRPISKIFVNVCREMVEKKFNEQFDDFQKTALEMADRFIKGHRKGQQQKALPLVYEFNLYGDVSLPKLVEIVIQEQNTKEIIYIFKDHNGDKRLILIKAFIDRCVDYNDKNHLTKCQKLIKELSLEPENYPNYIRKLLEKYIGYQLQNFKLFFIELVVNHDIRIIEVLIDELRKQGRKRQWKYFIVKYGLQRDYDLQLDPRQIAELSKIKNILLDHDQFGPTQVEVIQEVQSGNNHLYLRDFGLQQSDTIFVTSKNLKAINLKEEFALRRIGIDSQRAGGVHVFDPPDTQIVQIYTGKRVLIFDYKELKAQPAFKAIFAYIFTNCIIFGQDAQKEMTQFQKQLQLDIEQKVMQEMMRNRIVDAGKLFKKVYPKQTRSNLAHMCEVVFRKTLSKYQQCSGWKNRPLRRAQLHYAALDCIVPYVLCEELQKNLKK